MNDDKKATLTQDELRARLEQRKERLDYHLSNVRSELTIADVNLGGRPILDYVREQPLLAAGVAVGVGALAGMALGFARRDTPEPPSDYELWMSAYLKDVVDEAGARVSGGADADAALRRTLRHRAPVVVLEPEPEPVKEKAGSIASLVLNTALGFGVKFALDRLAHDLTGEDEIVEAVQDADDPDAAERAPMPPPEAIPVEPHYN